MTMLNPNLCYIEVCYKGTALYFGHGPPGFEITWFLC